jgi:uncharacterized protein (TIGR02145 family)
MKKILILVWSCLSFIVNGQTVTDTVVDIDGNVYKTVKIGDQVWMQENLRVTKFNDGTPLVKEDITPNCYNCTSRNWDTIRAMYTISPSIVSGENIINNGFIYNGNVASNNKNVCPIDWHVPTANDFIVLSKNTGGNTSWNLTIKDTTSLFKIGKYSYHKPSNIKPTDYGFYSPTFNFKEVSYLWTSQKVTYTIYYEYGLSTTINGQYVFKINWMASKTYYNNVTNDLEKTLRGYGYYIRCVHD